MRWFIFWLSFLLCCSTVLTTKVKAQEEVFLTAEQWNWLISDLDDVAINSSQYLPYLEWLENMPDYYQMVTLLNWLEAIYLTAWTSEAYLMQINLKAAGIQDAVAILEDAAFVLGEINWGVSDVKDSLWVIENKLLEIKTAAQGILTNSASLLTYSSNLNILTSNSYVTLNAINASASNMYTQLLLLSNLPPMYAESLIQSGYLSAISNKTDLIHAESLIHSAYLAAISNRTDIISHDLADLWLWGSMDGQGIKVWSTGIVVNVGTITGVVDIGTTGVVKAEMPDVDIDTNVDIFASLTNYQFGVSTGLEAIASFSGAQIAGASNAMAALGAPTSRYENAQDFLNINDIEAENKFQNLGWQKDSDWTVSVDLSDMFGAGYEYVKFGIDFTDYASLDSFVQGLRNIFVLCVLVTAAISAVGIYRGAEG